MELQIYISMNSSQSYYIKEAVLISDSCGSQTNICDITIQAGEANVNQPQVTCKRCSHTASGPEYHAMWGALTALLICAHAVPLYTEHVQLLLLLAPCLCMVQNVDCCAASKCTRTWFCMLMLVRQADLHAARPP